MLGNALGESATVSLTRLFSRDGGNAEEQFRETMAKAIEIGMQFPRLRSRLERGADAGYASAPEKSLEFGLEAIFDGLENQLAARRRGVELDRLRRSGPPLPSALPHEGPRSAEGGGERTGAKLVRGVM